MRYYNLMLRTGEEAIKENSRVKLREYAWENPIAAMNCYVYRNMKNGICFFAYREESNVVFADFSYDEAKESLDGVCNYILEMLNEVFLINGSIDEPCEITMCQFIEDLVEGRRREYVNTVSTRIIETAHLWYYAYYVNITNKEQLSYKYTEK